MRVDWLHLTVESTDGRRVSKVLVERVVAVQDESDEDED